MTTESVLTEEQLIRQATDALVDKLGVVETTRFLALKRRKRVDSVTRHRQWQEGLDKEEFLDEVFQN